ncbi:hypothetical protein [uncultured Haemophilus sp.]|uniref:hypothetical protein n=1 Tax=uncultured Haemophilus sp. TaxID=237779 RepID=UPI0015B736BB|nr:hypothetical protein [uncultured Haemophilus sp.]
MKNILTKLIFIIGLGAMLSGCATSTLWTNTNDLATGDKIETVTREKTIDSDEIIALGQDKNSGKVLIFGKKYLIHLHETSSEEIQKLTNAKLSNPFYINNAIEVISKDDTELKYVKADFSLQYKVTNELEKGKMKKLGFMCNEASCAKNLELTGDIYSLTDKAQIHRPNKQLAKSLPFKLKQQTSNIRYKTSSQAEGVVKAVGLTPLALLLDVVTLPIQIMFLTNN